MEHIGTGAMGNVYRAVHVMLDRTVAIKVLRPELAQDPVNVACFIAEAHAVNLLNHPHIIDITDVVNDPGQLPWMVMARLDGADLARLLDQGPLELGRTLRIVRQLCDALTAIHSADMVHRDIKPENLFITRRDGLDHLTVLDFGVAQIGGRRGLSLAPSDGLVGTPQYMAPEQAQGLRPDHRADLHAVGVILYEALTGGPPFRDDNLLALLDAVIHAVPGVPSQRVELPATVGAGLDLLTGSCLEKDPARRPQSAAEIAALIDGIAACLKASRVRHQVFARPTVSAPMGLFARPSVPTCVRQSTPSRLVLKPSRASLA